MAKNYRVIYERALNVKLAKGSASIHHIDGRSKEGAVNNIKNMVAIPDDTHQEYNKIVSKFPKAMKNIIRRGNYAVLKTKNIKELQYCLEVYEQMNLWLDIKNSIIAFGVEVTKEKYKNIVDINLVYDI